MHSTKLIPATLILSLLVVGCGDKRGPGPEPDISACTLDSDCPEGQVCIENLCVEEAEPIPDIGDCLADSDCPEGEVCENDQCVAKEGDLSKECSAENPNGTCPPGEICINGACKKPSSNINIIETIIDEKSPSKVKDYINIKTHIYGTLAILLNNQDDNTNGKTDTPVLPKIPTYTSKSGAKYKMLGNNLQSADTCWVKKDYSNDPAKKTFNKIQLAIDAQCKNIKIIGSDNGAETTFYEFIKIEFTKSFEINDPDKPITIAGNYNSDIVLSPSSTATTGISIDGKTGTSTLSKVTLKNLTISGWTCHNPDLAGGIYTRNAHLILENVTVVENSISNNNECVPGNGIHAENSNLELKGTVVTSNHPACTDPSKSCADPCDGADILWEVDCNACKACTFQYTKDNSVAGDELVLNGGSGLEPSDNYTVNCALQ